MRNSPQLPSAHISIHALREEGDVGRTARGLAAVHISIHALREEGDRYPCHAFPGPCDFYPRPPRGGRPGSGLFWGCRRRISIHALREEGDRRLWRRM